MADENATPNLNDTAPPTTEQPPPTGTPAGERLFTQADVNRIVAERIARERQKPAETARPNAQTQPSTTQPSTHTPAPSAAPATFDAEAFGDVLSEFPFDREQRAEIRNAAKRENPSDMDGFVAKWARMFGKQKAGGGTSSTPATQTAPGSTPAPQAPAGPPVTGGGPPANPTNVTDDTPLLRMSNADREALRQRIGDAEYVKRMREQFRTVRVRG